MKGSLGFCKTLKITEPTPECRSKIRNHDSMTALSGKHKINHKIQIPLFLLPFRDPGNCRHYPERIFLRPLQIDYLNIDTFNNLNIYLKNKFGNKFTKNIN